MSAVDLSIIIVNWNVRDTLRECLLSVRRELRLASDRCEIHVVDNASSDGSVDMLRAEFPEVRLRANTENVGFARANNQALPQCTGRYLLALNPDTVVQEAAIDRMLAFMEQHPEVGVLGCRLVNSDFSFQRAAGGAFPTLARLAWNYLFLNKLLPRRLAPAALFLEDDVRDDRDLDWVSGAAMMIRRSAVDDAIFDETFFMFGEDMELCERVRRRGLRVVQTGVATIVHHHGRSMARQDSEAVLACALKGPRAFYLRRHGRRLVRAYDLVLLVGYLIRWPTFAALSLGSRKAHYQQLSLESRRLARAAFRLLGERQPQGTA
jgi:GT2 family glycosyltransferase